MPLLDRSISSDKERLEEQIIKIKSNNRNLLHAGLLGAVFMATVLGFTIHEARLRSYSQMKRIYHTCQEIKDKSTFVITPFGTQTCEEVEQFYQEKKNWLYEPL